jgi:archaellum biogenesis ATPase FlaH
MKFPRKFFVSIFRNILQDHHLDIEIRCLSRLNDKDNSYPPKQFWCRSLAELQSNWPEIRKINRRGYDIHFTVVARQRKFQGKKEHPLPGKPLWVCFWADLDVGKDKPYPTLKAAYQAVRESLSRPNIIVESGSGLHPYYLLRKPRAVSRKKAEALLKTITQSLRGDIGAARATRLMRVPNTINHKYGKMARYKIIRQKRYSLKTFERRWSRRKSKEAVTARIDHGRFFELFSRFVPDLTVSPNGVWAHGKCPFHDDRHPSFYLNVEDGRWGCHAEACRKKGSVGQFGPAIGALFSAANGNDTDKLLRWKDIPLASEATEENLQWLAAGRIPAKQVTVIAAHKDSYKTMLMLALAKAAVSEGEFLGRRTKQMRVLYLNREMPKAVFDSYCKTLGLDKSNRRFKILSSLWDTGIKPPTPGDKLLRRFARRYKPLMIFDSFIRFFPGRMEDPKAINNFMEQLNELAALGATVVILHHLPKHDVASEGYGSVYILNGADFGWRITIEGDKYGSEANKILKVQNTKTKMGDYFSMKLRPLLKMTGGFKVLDDTLRPVPISERPN